MPDLMLIIEAVMIIVVGILITVAFVLGMANMLGAEEVSCNTLWCEFKLPTNTEIHESCYQDGIQVNCSEIFDNVNQPQLIVNEQ